MLIFKEGNIFGTSCEYLVNTVNCVGVMGAGLALLFKKRYPLMFQKYIKDCQNKIYKPGKIYIYNGKDGKIINFTTKNHFRDSSKIEYIENGLKDFVNTYKLKNVSSVAFPMLGCGLGNLKEDDVKPLMIKYLEKIDIPIEIWKFEAKKTRNCCF